MAALPPSSSSRSLRSSPPKCTRGPLLELPLDQFLAPPTMPTSSKLGTSTKRPVSPGTPVLYSPAKRRILNEEGLFAAKNPLSATTMTTSTAPSSKQSVKATPHYYQQHQQNAAKFAQALMGPDSPVRKLDFGTPKNAVGSKTPLRQSTEDKLAPSPELKATTRSRPRGCETDEDCFSISSQTPSQPPHPQSQSQNSATLSSSSSSSSLHTHHHTEFHSIPRELPLPVNPQSEHYPGFVVYQDPHIYIPTIRLTSSAPSSIPNATLAPLDGNFDDDRDMELPDLRELVKENLAPRRKVRKTATAPIPEKVQLFSPPSATSSSVPATPPREYLLREEVLTPRRLSIFGVGVGSGLGVAQPPPSKEDRRNMKKILEEEVDGDRGDA